MKQKIGILCPSDSEAAPFLADMEGVTETRKAMLRFYEGTFHGVDVVTLFSGVCKVNAALATEESMLRRAEIVFRNVEAYLDGCPENVCPL